MGEAVKPLMTWISGYIKGAAPGVTNLSVLNLEYQDTGRIWKVWRELAP